MYTDTPNSDSENDVKLYNDILNKIENKSHVLLCGDFNHPEIDWEFESVSCNSEHKASVFMKFYRDSFLHQHVTFNTHLRGCQTPILIDPVMTNEECMIKNLEGKAPLGNSHHQLICFRYICYTTVHTSQNERYLYQKGDYDKLKKYVQEVDMSNHVVNLGLEEAWRSVKETILEAVKDCVPKRKAGSSRASNKPIWFNEEILDKLKNKRQAYRKYNKTREGKDYTLYANARNVVKAACRKAVK